AIGEGDAEQPAGRLERWKRRLLDLSMRNKLLNFKVGKGTIELLCPDAGALEDRLAGGASLRLLPDPAPASRQGSSASAIPGVEAIVPDRIALAADALAGNAVHTTLAPEDLEARVLDLYRTVRTTMEETGANNLYLAIGFVSWTPKPTEARGAIRAGTYRAPLLLVPVALERKGVRSGFTLRRHDEPATINPTFARASPSTARFIATRASTHSSIADLKLPLQADSSQTAAIVAATEGRSFVLYGPPGTGKSQTISNLIAHLLSAGKTVLFVSQKATALEVVRRRLEKAGLGPFCLEVHSAKAQKSAVLDQLRTAWEFQADGVDEPWRLTAEALQATRDQLNAHVEVLHRRWPNGMSAYGAFGQVIAGRGLAPGLTIECADPAADTEDALRVMAQRLTELADLGKEIGNPSVHPLRVVGKRVWTPAWQR
ncbi:MAG: DUF4011 domain-containing protein, partial [Proteobacteria bacterium]|nr:DUF4011 domain-containing protein [Pseudomonadota bacterium]